MKSKDRISGELRRSPLEMESKTAFLSKWPVNRDEEK